MKKLILLLFLLVGASRLFAQTEQQFAETFLKSVQDKNFSLLKPYLNPKISTMKSKWEQVVENAHRKGFNIKAVKIKSVIPGQQIPNLPLKTIIALYDYDGKEWDDLLLMISTDKKFTLMEIPVTHRMFMLIEDRRGKNIEDASKK